MFDKHPADRLLLDSGPIWEKVTAAIDEEWHPQGTMMGSGTVISEQAPLRELPAFSGDASVLYEDFLPADVVAATRHWYILVDGRGRGEADTRPPRIREDTFCILCPALYPRNTSPFFERNAFRISSGERSVSIWLEPCANYAGHWGFRPYAYGAVEPSMERCSGLG